MPSNLLLVSANQMKDPYPVYPLGLAYIHAFLNQYPDQFHIAIFDFIDKDYEDYIRVIQDFKPQFIGISLRNVDDVNAYAQESFVKHYQRIIAVSREHTQASLIIGGSGYSIFPERMFTAINPDFGIYGEGELHFFELLTALQNGKDYSLIDNLIFRKGDALVFNRNKQSLKHIDLCFEPQMLDYYWQHSGMLNIQTKRGCPFNCIYCTYPLIEGRKVRTLDEDSIIDKLEYLSRKKNIDYFFFTDSVFNLDTGYNLRLAERIIRLGLKIRWGAYFNFKQIDEESLALYQRAGLTHIEFGTDSLSDAILQHYRKPFTVEDIYSVSRICVRLGIDHAHFLILAGLGETEETLDETFSNSMKLEHTVFFPFIGLRIYPNTALHEIALKEGKVSPDNDLLLPAYYFSDQVDLTSLKTRAVKTGKSWIFPDDDLSGIMKKMRMREKKGPLWEYLIQ